MSSEISTLPPPHRAKTPYQQLVNRADTPGLRRFLKQLVKTLSPVEAAWHSFNCKDRKVASVIGRQCMQRLNITLPALMDLCGLGIDKDLQDLVRLRDAKKMTYFTNFGNVVDEREDDDNFTQLKALELSLKIKGNLKESGEAAQQMNMVVMGDVIVDNKPFRFNVGKPIDVS